MTRGYVTLVYKGKLKEIQNFRSKSPQKSIQSSKAFKAAKHSNPSFFLNVMATQSLLEFLSLHLPDFSSRSTTFSGNTTSSKYKHTDIKEVVDWPEFNREAILQRFGPILEAIQVQISPPGTPPGSIQSEDSFAGYFYELVRPRVRRALRKTFEHLAPLSERRLVSVGLENGFEALIIDQYKPDTAFRLIDPTDPSSPNRAPGELKVSWKWKSSYRNSRDREEMTEYKKVLAQVNFYSCQHQTRYGYVLTDTEFVAIKRLDANGRVAVAEPIPWVSDKEDESSLLLGLWYLGMLAAEEDTWNLPVPVVTQQIANRPQRR